MVVFTAGLLGAWLATSSAALANSRNSGSARICQKGGWASPNLQTNSGQSISFASQDECVAYGATVGPLYKPLLTATPDDVVEGQLSAWSAAGFHPSSLGTMTIQNVGGAGGSITLPAMTTSMGGLPDGVGNVFEAGACALGVTGAELTLVDSFGVHASTIVYLDCP
jgi:hypothetical protein